MLLGLFFKSIFKKKNNILSKEFQFLSMNTNSKSYKAYSSKGLKKTK